MKSWRSKKRRAAQKNQPFLPGLFNGSGPSKPGHKPASPGEYALERARLRLPIVIICFALFFMVASTRVSLLSLDKQPTQNQPLQAMSGQTQVSSRADIVDRNGTILATSLPTIMLMADTQKLINAKDSAQKLKKILPGFDEARLLSTDDAQSRYRVLHRHLTPRQYYEVNRLGIAGLEYVPDESRLYPMGNTAAHILGYTDIDNKGIAGLEKAHNQRLQSSPAALETTIDIRLQTIMHRELAASIKEFRALAGTGLIMDIHTGEILSMVSLPDYNPRHAGTASEDAKFNRATLGVYEMGSTFKSFNTALALEVCGIHAGERFDTTQPISIGGRTIRDFHPVKRWLNVAEIFIESSNIGSARMAEKCGRTEQRAFLHKLGLMEKIDLEIPEVGAPLVPSLKRWGDTTTMTVSYGHGIAVNAVQLASAYASLINGGFRVHPSLLKENAGHQVSAKKERVLSEQNSAKLRALTRLVVTHGTAKQAEVTGYMVGGKTGTADKAQGRRYNENARISSFIGAFPMSAPRYVVLTLLDDPKGIPKTHGFATGGWTAAPVAGRIISQVAPLLNLAPIDHSVMAATDRQIVRPLGQTVLATLAPKKETNSYAALESDNAP